VQFEVLSSQAVSGATRASHRAAANKQFLAQLEGDHAFRQFFDDLLGTDVAAHIGSGSSGLRNPPGTEWHHPTWDPSSMLLLRRGVHRHPDLQYILHSGPGAAVDSRNSSVEEANLDSGDFRARSVRLAERLGYALPTDLPLLESDLRIREVEAVIDRTLARYAAVAVSFGFDPDAAARWLEREGLPSALAPSERVAISGRSNASSGVESLWALC
jgi:hypothetical protein